MTNPPPAIPVEQVDREAAADFVPTNNDEWTRAVRAGKHDSNPIVQAFARHRTQPTPNEEGLRLRIAELEAALAPIAAPHVNLSDQQSDDAMIGARISVGTIRRARAVLASDGDGK